MLQQLLNIIRQDGTLQPSVLAARMNLSTAMIEAMMDDLKRMGVLKRVDTACGEGGACGGCPMTNNCGSQSNSGKLWVLAHK